MSDGGQRGSLPIAPRELLPGGHYDDLSAGCLGALVRLLGHEAQDGHLPASMNALAQRSGVDPQAFRQKVWPHIKGHFQYAPGAEGERVVSKASRRRKEGGKSGARGRWQYRDREDGVVPPEGAGELQHQVTKVFNHWRDARARAMDKDRGPRMKPTGKRMSKIRARLKDGYSVEDLCRAALGCLSSRQNVEHGHTDAELIYRDQQKVEQYLAWYHNGVPDQFGYTPGIETPASNRGARSPKRSNRYDHLKE